MATIAEKREHARIDISIPVRYKELHGNNYLTRGALTKNLSEGGIRFRADRFMPLACHLVVELKFPNAENTVKVVSKIAWISKLPATDSFEIGSRFLASTDEDEQALSRFISALRQ